MALSVSCRAILNLSSLGEEVVSWLIPRFKAVKEKAVVAQAWEALPALQLQGPRLDGRAATL